MIRQLLITTSCALAVLTAGCAAHPEPIVDRKGVNETQLASDWEECEAYSEQVRIERGAARGAAAGAVIGAATGAISGDVGEGAGYGAIFGASRSGLNGDRERQQVFKRCLRGRGYRVLN
ncbi:MAG: glycine zipper family protein [Pseudomonadota bacterium]